MKIIVLGQQKGGVGKSTLAANLAVAVAGQGKRVMIVDADKQQTCVKWGSRRQLAGTDPTVSYAALFATEPNGSDFIATIRKLSEADKFDVCFIDVGGRDNRELRLSLFLADVLIAPCLPSQADVESLNEFDAMIGEVLAGNPDLRTITIINKANRGLNFSHEIELASDAIEEMTNLQRPVAVIGERPNFRSAWMEGQGVHDLKTASAKAAQEEIEQVVRAL